MTLEEHKFRPTQLLPPPSHKRNLEFPNSQSQVPNGGNFFSTKIDNFNFIMNEATNENFKKLIKNHYTEPCHGNLNKNERKNGIRIKKINCSCLKENCMTTKCLCKKNQFFCFDCTCLNCANSLPGFNKNNYSMSSLFEKQFKLKEKSKKV